MPDSISATFVAHAAFNVVGIIGIPLAAVIIMGSFPMVLAPSWVIIVIVVAPMTAFSLGTTVVFFTIGVVTAF